MDGFKSAAQAYFNDENFSDLTIICAATGKLYKSHRFLLSVHSKWFERCCKGTFAEGSSKRIELKGDVPAAVDRMMEFFYKFDYNSDVPNTEDLTQEVKADPEEEFATQKIESKLELHAWMYAIAEKYEISDLKKLSLAKFKEELKIQKLTRADVELVVKLIYSILPLPESDTALRERVVDRWIGIMGISRQKDDTNELVAISRSHPLFAADVVRRFISPSTNTSVALKCTNCKDFWENAYDFKRDEFRCPRCYVIRTYNSIKWTSTIDIHDD